MKKRFFALALCLLALWIGTASAAGIDKSFSTLESYIKNPKSVSKDNALKALDEIRAYIGESESTFVLNTSTLKFHRPSCRYAEQIQEDKRMEFTGAREDLIERGYDACKVCNP